MIEKSSQQRFFGQRQRFVLLAGAHGSCQGCGISLSGGFHADHIQPFSRGGRTDVINGQALCPDCNQRKGAKPGLLNLAVNGTVGKAYGAPNEGDNTRSEGDSVPSEDNARCQHSVPSKCILPSKYISPSKSSVSRDYDRLYSPVPLFPWQQQGVSTWMERRGQGQNDMMVLACTGAGKTALALHIARLEMAANRCARMIVVVPTRQLKQQWAKAAQKAGFTLTACWGNGAVGLPENVHGAVITYSQLARLPDAVRLLCGRYSVLAVMDEIHRGGSGLAWGDSLLEAFEGAEARLCLSGTPVRSDGLPLPFLRYSADGDRDRSRGRGRVLADVTYSVAQAVADGVIRPVFFHVFGGHFRWLDGGQVRSATFEDRLGQTGQAQRLRAAINAAGGWLAQVLTHAVHDLCVSRNTHLQAKGMVVCADAAHARKVAAKLAAMTGEEPALALSDDPGSAEALEAFRRSDASWLVVCKMAGEGFDCPNLRCCVFASTTCTEVFFRQVVGRVVRTVSGLLYQDGSVYLPADPRLIRLAESFEVPHGSVESDEFLNSGASLNTNGSLNTEGLVQEHGFGEDATELRTRPFRLLTSEAAAPQVITGGDVISPDLMQDAQLLKASRPGLTVFPDHYVASQLTGVKAGELEFEETDLAKSAAARMHAPIAGSLPLIAGCAAPALLGVPGGANPTASDADLYTVDSAEACDEAEINDEQEINGEQETYDEKESRLRRSCHRLAAEIARELDTPVKSVYNFYQTLLGVKQAEASLAQLEARHNMMLIKANELRHVRCESAVQHFVFP